jgi:hypothetical protein
MTNPFGRGSAPGREQPDYLRSGSFKPGHEKQGGRKKGTPNAFSIDYKKAILEAAYRIGNDGNGKDGILGYFLWVGKRHPTVFYTILWVSLLALETTRRRSHAERWTKSTEAFGSILGLQARTGRSGQLFRGSPARRGIGPASPFLWAI